MVTMNSCRGMWARRPERAAVPAKPGPTDRRVVRAGGAHLFHSRSTWTCRAWRLWSAPPTLRQPMPKTIFLALAIALPGCASSRQAGRATDGSITAIYSPPLRPGAAGSMMFLSTPARAPEAVAFDDPSRPLPATRQIEAHLNTIALSPVPGPCFSRRIACDLVTRPRPRLLSFSKRSAILAASSISISKGIRTRMSGARFPDSGPRLPAVICKDSKSGSG